MNSCTTCTRPVPDTAFGCPACAADLARRLDQLAGAIPELQITIAKLDRITAPGGNTPPEYIPDTIQQPGPTQHVLTFGWSASRERPERGALKATGMPFNPGTSSQGRYIQGELVRWARKVVTETGRLPATSSGSAVARYLAQHVNRARYREYWSQFHTDLLPLFGLTTYLIDRPADRTYVGPCSAEVGEPEADCPVNCDCHNSPLHSCSEPGGCGSAGCGQTKPCGADVYAHVGAERTSCRACGAEYVVADCQAWMRDQLRDLLARPTEIAGMLARLGINVTYRRLMKYIEKGHVVAHGADTNARPLYRVGDVLEIIARNETPRRAGQSSRGAANLPRTG